MKDNARLQKEVKHRIQYMKDYIEKIDKGIYRGFFHVARDFFNSSVMIHSLLTFFFVKYR
jgi:hypothetical protein